jgi:hypothetical protein
MKTTFKFNTLMGLVALLTFLPITSQCQIKVFDNGNVGVKYTTSTPLSKFVFNTQGNTSYDVYFYAGSRSSSGGTLFSQIATGTGSANHIYGIIGQANLGSGNYLYGTRGAATNTTALTTGRAYGIYGIAGNAASGYNYGVYGYLYGSNNGAAVFGTTTGDATIAGKYAGYFKGDVYVTGLMSTNTLSVRSSDEKFKSNIVTITSSEAYDKISLLRPTTYYLRQQEVVSADSAKVSYLYDPDSEVFKKRKYGFVAQELQDIFPDLVYTLQDETLAIDYTGLIPVMIQAIQEQRKRIEEMEAALNELKKKVEDLSSNR